MKWILHDAGSQYSEVLSEFADEVFYADGKYAACQGCFKCWTKHPASCFMKDKLHTICRKAGQANELIIITKNTYGSYSAVIKNVLDRSIGISTPLSTYRGGQMHHCLRYGTQSLLKVLVYGEMTAQEREAWKTLVKRNAINQGYERGEVHFLSKLENVEDLL